MDHDPRWRLDGRLALVTGASAGIGLAIAHALAGRGADLWLVARDPDALEAARLELAEAHPASRVRALAADVADAGARGALFDAIEDAGEPLSLLVNNVGANATRAAMDYDDAEWRAIRSCASTRARRSSTWARCRARSTCAPARPTA